ncbi:hypothetical protein [Streptomyces canus]|uniref:hypothetical protein n=1 Tax=Streptomyces canus TaxID=58343 RepID=UPI00352F5E68
MPPGEHNVVSGNGPVPGRALGLHLDVDMLSFTGPTASNSRSCQHGSPPSNGTRHSRAHRATRRLTRPEGHRPPGTAPPSRAGVVELSAGTGPVKCW